MACAILSHATLARDLMVTFNVALANLTQMGFDAFFFARADYQDIIKRRKERTMELIWQGSKSLGASAEVGDLELLVVLNSKPLDLWHWRGCLNFLRLKIVAQRTCSFVVGRSGQFSGELMYEPVKLN